MIVNQCNVAIGDKFVYSIYLLFDFWIDQKIMEPEVKQNMYKKQGLCQYDIYYIFLLYCCISVTGRTFRLSEKDP